MYKLLVREKVILQRLQHERVSSIIHTYTDPFDNDIVYLGE